MITYSANDNTLKLDITKSKYMTIQYSISLIEPDDCESYFKMHQKSWLATYPNTKLGITKTKLKLKLNQIPMDKKVSKLSKLITNGKKPNFYVLKIAEKVIGMIDVKVHKKNIGEIAMIYLDPDYIGQGFGSDLVEFAFDALYNLGCTSVIVKVVDYNKRAIKFYLKNGFKIKAKLDDVFDILDDISLTMYEMERKL